MVTTSFTSLRKPFGYVLTLLLSPVCLCAGLAAQIPSVVSSSPVAVPHNESFGAPWQNAVSNRGDFVVFDFKTTGMYQYPGNGGPEITLAAPGAIAGGFTDSGIAIDPRNNNIYLNNNYNGGLIEYPFDAATGTWDLPSVVVAQGLAGNLGGSCGNYFQSAGLAMNDNGVLAVATENGCGVEIFTVPIDASGNFGAATAIVSGMSARAKTVAIDDAGNISFTEDAGGLVGAYFIPAGTTGLATDTGVTRIDPSLGNVQGVSNDRSGNVYVADGSAGVYLIPLMSGAPNTAQAVLLTTATAQSNASLDQVHGVLFVPISSWNGFNDLVKIDLNHADLGSAVVGSTSATPTAVYYSFTAGATPASFAIEEAGSTSADFAVATGGTCVAGTAQAAGSSCTVSVNFTPHTVGGVSASLVMLDGNGNVLVTTALHGVGQGSSVLVAPGTETAIGSGLKTPSQVATDSFGNVYVADSGLGKVLEYAKGSGAGATPVSIGTGLVAPTGVAVDGSGDVFIADSGNVLEVPFGAAGLNAAGQSTLQTGFGTNLKLATDGIGNIFVADPDNQRVAELSSLVIGTSEIDLTGFTQLTAITAGQSGTLFVANGQNLVQVSPYNVQTTVSNTLPAATGLAVDASGAVYVTSASQTVRIPNEAGTLNAADQIVLAAGATQPTSVAVDSVGNVYVTDAAAGDVDYVSTSGFLNLGTLTSTTGTASGNVTIIDDGNAPLNVTGFAATPDYSATSNTCVGTPVAVGFTCGATITFSPGAGDQGTLAGEVLIQGDEANAPVGVNVTGVGAALAASTTTITVTAPTVTNAAAVIKVVSTSGTGPVPTGNATVTVTGNGITPIVITQPLVNGTVTINETALPVGSYTFTVAYGGDRVYGTSTASAAVVIGVGAVTLVQPAQSTVPTYVLAAGQGAAEPYDGSQQAYYYTYLITVHTANGAPLIGQPIYDSTGALTGYDYGSVTLTQADGTAVCQPVEVNADGTAPFATSCVNIDTSNNQIPNVQTSYTLTPVYNSNTDMNYAMATGVAFTFIAIRNPSVIITSSPASVTVAPGSTVTATLTLTSLLGYGVTGVNGNLNNYSLPVTLDCDGLPAHATCSFSYPTPDSSDASSVDVTPTTPGQVVMTINTDVTVGTTPTASLRTTSPGFLAAMFGFSLFGLAFGKRTLRRRLSQCLLILIFCGTIGSLAACGTTNISPNPILATPAGTYNVIVTAKQAGSKVIAGSSPGTTQTVYGNGNQMSIPFTMTVTVQ